MKFLSTIVAVAALFASSISASPLGDLSELNVRALTDYDINTAIQKWMADPKTRKRLTNNCNTKGGWEGWAQAELEDEFKDEFRLSQGLREVSKVYVKGKLADLVLPKTTQKRGMIIELKCENAFGQKGVKLLDPVNADVYKKSNVRPEFSDYTFVALAMAFTPDADKSLRKIGMKSIAKAPVAPKNTMQTYREDFKLDGLSNDMEDLNEALNALFISKSRPSSPTSPPPSPKGKPAPGKGKKPI